MINLLSGESDEIIGEFKALDGRETFIQLKSSSFLLTEDVERNVFYCWWVMRTI